MKSINISQMMGPPLENISSKNDSSYDYPGAKDGAPGLLSMKNTLKRVQRQHFTKESKVEDNPHLYEEALPPLNSGRRAES